MKTNPFTRTPGIAGTAYINMHHADKIIESFGNPDSYKYVYKITGLRGSGKSVEYGKVLEYFNTKSNWLVYTLSAAGNPIKTLISKLSREKFIDSSERSVTVSIGAGTEGNIAVIKGNANANYQRTTFTNANYYSDEAALTEMVQAANDNGYNVLIGVDDISKTDEMVKFLSILGSMIIDSTKRIYFLCTGLTKNIEDFVSSPSLTFFKRSDTAEIEALSKYDVALKYEELLGVNHETSILLAKLVKGYAYAYQVMGSLYFSKKNEETVVDLIPDFDKILSQDSYDLIWASLTEAEKIFVRCILRSETGKVADIKEGMQNPKSFDTFRNRLRKKHLINTEKYGYIKINLPRFKEFVDNWEAE